MKNKSDQELEIMEMDTITIHRSVKTDGIFMGNRVCDHCGKNKDTYGGKTCSHGHFICHSCASGHVHCPLCGHTLR
jgi:transposase-like protein